MNGLTKITIQDQEHDIYFGMMAIENFYKESGDLEEGSLLQTGQIACLVFNGMKNAAYRNGGKLTVPFSAVYDTVEDMTMAGDQSLIEIVEVFNQSKAVKYLTEKAGEVKKKKSTGKKLSRSPSGR